MYKFYVDSPKQYDVRVRVAAYSGGKRIKLIIIPDDDHKPPFSKEFTVPADGWHDFNDLLWKHVHLEKGHYGLQVLFVTGQVAEKILIIIELK